MNPNTNIEWALHYLNKGLSILPVRPKEKWPRLPQWKEYQNHLPTKDEVVSWWEKWPDSCLGFVTGPVSGIVILDLDGVNLKDFSKIYPLPQDTPVVKTGKGWHFYLKNPEYETRNFAKKIPGVDFRGTGGFAMLPPSTHETGNQYEWSIELNSKDELAEMPDWLVNLLKPSIPNKASEGLKEGSRNTDMHKIMSRLRGELSDSMYQAVGRDIVLAIANRCLPPLDQKEAIQIYDSVLKNYGAGREEQAKQLSEPISLEALYNKELPPVDWLADKIFTRKAINCVSGAPNQGKTFITQHLAVEVSRGGKFLNHFDTNQSGVLICNEEDNESLLQQRAKLLANEFNLPLYFYIQEGIKLDDQTVDQLIDRMKAHNLTVIIFDSLSTIHSANENDSKEMGEVFDQFQKFIREDYTVIFTHHHRKKPIGKDKDNGQEQTRGSSVINARIASHLVCEEVVVDGKKYFKLTQAKLKASKKLDNPFLVELQETNDGLSLIYTRDYQSGEEVVSGIISQILEREEEGWLPVDYYIDLKIGQDRAVRAALNNLTQRGIFEKKTLAELKKDNVFPKETKGAGNKGFYRCIP